VRWLLLLLVCLNASAKGFKSLTAYGVNADMNKFGVIARLKVQGFSYTYQALPNSNIANHSKGKFIRGSDWLEIDFADSNVFCIRTSRVTLDNFVLSFGDPEKQVVAVLGQPNYRYPKTGKDWVCYEGDPVPVYHLNVHYAGKKVTYFTIDP